MYRVTVRGADGKSRTTVYFAQTRANAAAQLHRDRGREAFAWHVASGMPTFAANVPELHHPDDPPCAGCPRRACGDYDLCRKKRIVP